MMHDRQIDHISAQTTRFDALFPDRRGECESELKNAQQVMLRILKIVDDICHRHSIDYWIDGGTLLGAIRHKGFIPWDDDLDIAMPRKDYERFLAIAARELPPDLFLQTAQTDATYDSFGKPPCKVRDELSLIMESHQPRQSNHPGLFIDIFPVDRMHQSGPGRRADERMKRKYWNLCVLYNLRWEWSKDLKANVRNLAFLAKYLFKLDFWLKRYMKKAERRIADNQELKNDCRLGFGFDVPWVRFFDMDEIYPLQRIPFEDGSFPAPNNCDGMLKRYYGDYMQLPPAEKRRSPHFGSLVVDRRVDVV